MKLKEQEWKVIDAKESRKVFQEAVKERRMFKKNGLERAIEKAKEEVSER
jgi:hypothetical protein